MWWIGNGSMNGGGGNGREYLVCEWVWERSNNWSDE